MSGYQFNWDPIWENRVLILDGLLTTIELSLAALVLTVLVGTVLGTFGSSHSKILRAAVAVYVESMRNVPLLIHMYAWYMGLAFLKLPPFACAVFGLTLYSSAYVAELVRAGIGSVPGGQMQAALATGLTALQANVFVIYPQALRIIAPSLANLSSQLIKDSSLASVIAVAELTYQAGAIEGQTFRTFEIYITIAALYLMLVMIVTLALMFLTGARVESLPARVADA
jgi:His/Glu/Gln/Arg/opine family amino acid ABC transporter permease subunit